MFDGIIDINHNAEIDFARVQTAGIIAIIHKATEGVTVQDKRYHPRRDEAKAAGFLWGAYHFSSGLTVADQVANFLTFAQPEEDELVALDWEESSMKGSKNMTRAQAEEFVQRVADKLGRLPAVYGGGLMRDQLTGVKKSVLSGCPLWYQRYLSTPKGIPTIFDSFTLWQYTDGHLGTKPTFTDGVSEKDDHGHSINGVADRNRFDGTADELRERWPFR
jgi:lysozyme